MTRIFLFVLFLASWVCAQLPAPAVIPSSSFGVSEIANCGTVPFGGTTLIQCSSDCFAGCVTCATNPIGDSCFMYTDPSLTGQFAVTSTTVVGPCRNPRIGAGLYIGTLFFDANDQFNRLTPGVALPPLYLIAPSNSLSAPLGPTLCMPESDLLFVDVSQGVIVSAGWYSLFTVFGVTRDAFGVFWQLPNQPSAIGTQWDVQSARLDATTLLLYLSSSSTFEVMP